MPLGTEDHVCTGEIICEMVFDVEEWKSGLRWFLNGWNIAYGDTVLRVPPLRSG